MTNAPHFMYSLLRTYEGFEKTAMTQAQLLESQTERDFEEMRRLESEKLARIEEFSASQSSRKNWSLLSSVVDYITPLLTTGLGAYYSLTKEETRTAGYLMIAAGVTNIASRILPSSSAYETISSWMTSSKDMQETIASRLEAGMQYASYVFGAAGSVLACYQPGTAPDLSMVNTAINVGTHGIHFGKSLVEKNVALINSAVQHTESTINQLFQRIQQTGKESERLSHSIGDICEALKTAIQTLYSRN